MLHIRYLLDVDGNKPFIELNLSEVDFFEEAFSHLKKKTGVFIDPYGDTRIYPDHQRIVIDFLASNKDKTAIKLRDFFKTASDKDEVLFASGD